MRRLRKVAVAGALAIVLVFGLWKIAAQAREIDRLNRRIDQLERLARQPRPAPPPAPQPDACGGGEQSDQPLPNLQAQT